MLTFIPCTCGAVHRELETYNDVESRKFRQILEVVFIGMLCFCSVDHLALK